MTDTETVTSLNNVFDTFEEANAFRKTLKHPESYGLYGMYQSEDKQLWVAMPLHVLDAMMAKEEMK
jgi:hypothetical protein